MSLKTLSSRVSESSLVTEAKELSRLVERW